MPNPPDPIPFPSSRGDDAVRWLETRGLTTHVPTFQSSDYELALTDPFLYYLQRRLGLCDPLRYSEALTRGTWAHVAIESLFQRLPDEDRKVHFRTALDNRMTELSELASVGALPAAHIEAFLQVELRDAQQAQAWVETAWALEPAYAVLSSAKPKSWKAIFERPTLICLGTEIRLVTYPLGAKKPPAVIHVDALLWDQTTNMLWVADLKTCDCSPQVRALTCPIEFQTQHYLFTVEDLLKSGHLHEKFPLLPPDVKLGGMMHLVMQKPTIDFGQNDRPFTEYIHILKSGPRKDQSEVRREYTGEPQFELYLQRCSRWYRAKGEYEHLVEQRMEDPPVNISFTSWPKDPSNDIHFEEYGARLKFLSDMATKPGRPDLFLRNPSNARLFGKLTPFSEFYVTPVQYWPTIIEQKRLTVKFRNADLMPR